MIGLLQEEQDLETLGIHSVFDGFYDPEDGAVGTIRQERQLTDRGAMIEGYLRRLHLLSQKQRIMRARIAAERIINRKVGF